MSILYGDGIHDDTLAIQEMIDSGVCEVSLPIPKVCYLISKPLELPSNFRLVLPRFAEIKLAKNSNCVMLKNKTVTDRADRIPLGIYDFVNEYSPDFPCSDIEVKGGVWNCNNKEQKPNPMMTGDRESGYGGFGMLFYNVKNLRITSLTMKDPVTYAIIFDRVSYFTVDNIDFDFNYGNPMATNMDGVHLNGNCHFGKISNLKGACYDDMVALNADEGSAGPITNIDINGLYAEDCHSAVRMLTVDYALEYIHISNVFGTYFQYCIGITKHYCGEPHGYYDGIVLENICASKAERIPVYNKPENSRVFQIVFIERDLKIRNLKISGLYRKEYITPVETILVDKVTEIENFVLENISTENHTDAEEMPILVCNGTIKRLDARNIFADGKEVELKV